ncbi:hypothetical protein LUZ60_002090 [Juncus effusus]|nr:hypothetical protein LUZ60_002090 [Juncus effusus]
MSIFIRHVIGDLTIGKPDLTELYETDSLEAAARVLVASPEASAVVLRRSPVREERFLGLINAMDLVGFLARSCPAEDQVQRESLMREKRIGDVMVGDPGALKEVDPGTRLIDVLEMMKQGTKRVIVRKTLSYQGISKRFSLLFNGKWLKSSPLPSPSSPSPPFPSPPSPLPEKFCCISREDLTRFLIGCLGALAPLPLTSISSLNIINRNFAFIEASALALEVITKTPLDPCAVAVVEMGTDGLKKIVGDISAYKLWKCDYVSVAWALANLSAGQFVIGTDENGSGEVTVPIIVPDLESGTVALPKRRFSSRSIGFFNNKVDGVGMNGSFKGGVYRGRSSPLTCKKDSSLAAVMAQMLSHRATHVWVTDEEGSLVGIVGYVDILNAVTKR